MLKEKIRNLCQSRGITIMKLETDLDFGSGTIAKWDKSSPKIESIKKVAQYFGVSIDYILDIEKPAELPPDLAERQEKIEKLNSLFNQMTPEQQRLLLGVAENMRGAK